MESKEELPEVSVFYIHAIAPGHCGCQVIFFKSRGKLGEEKNWGWG